MFFKAHHLNLKPYTKAEQNIISEIKSYVRKEISVLKSTEQFLQEYYNKTNGSTRRIKQQNEATI